MRGLSTGSVLIACLLAGRSLASIGPVADLVISNKDVSPDGFTRGAVVAGDSTIGPLIVANKGDQLQINVVNNLDDDTMLQSTSIHWHGFVQKGTAWADGVAFVSQCPIPKGDSFLYDFSTGDQAGTFWYHSHLSTQYCDGLRGPIVVYDPEDPYLSLYDVDDGKSTYYIRLIPTPHAIPSRLESTVITLSDWYHTKAKQIAFGTPDSTLINGLGRWSQGDLTAPLSVITVESGKRYRLRVVNTACDPMYDFHIDQHNFTVIEADSVSHQPVTADSVKIYAGQRYSVILEANQPVGNYWIRANPNVGSTGFTMGINSAILRYVGASEEEPDNTAFTSAAPLSETSLIPLESPGAPGLPQAGGVDAAYHLNFQFGSTGTFTLNGNTFTPPTVPVLLQILSGAQTPESLLPEGFVLPLPGDSTVELSFTGGLLGIEHPMHLHGHTFDVVRPAGSSTYNYENPVRRDVVSIGGASDNVTIRFTTDNPGPWILHCHIDWHLEAGFAVVFAEKTDSWNSTITPSTDWDTLCPAYDSLTDGDL
ncbi:laccase, multicopper oxidase, benzenediol:oxygen oxidorectuctase [Marasmius crinis-equi]|uniref:Laccase, multicopper oxidase, benzenediol:oxygen oxidorectuctase n=1 Tax=Marasmius crinis-equi TaxID=585013 RepID=A0ABR3FAZ5_9AGAR